MVLGGATCIAHMALVALLHVVSSREAARVGYSSNWVVCVRLVLFLAFVFTGSITVFFMALPLRPDSVGAHLQFLVFLWRCVA